MKWVFFAALLLGAPSVYGQSRTWNIITFGDSTTAARKEVAAVYSDLIQEELHRLGYQAQVANAGVPGNTTADARARFDKDVLARRPNLVIIQFGINDSAVDVWKNPPATKPRVALAAFRENLLYFIQRLRERQAAVVLMTPNPLCWTEKLIEMYSKKPYLPGRKDGFNVTLNAYTDMVRDISVSEHVPLVDVGAVLRSHPEGACHFLLDGMHPNDQGHRLIADLLIGRLISLLE